MIKATILTAVMLSCAAFRAQSVSDYQFIQIQNNEKEFANNKFGLTDLLRAKLNAKRYTVLSEMQGIDLGRTSDPCSILQAHVVNSSSFLTNKFKIDFRDCKGKTVIAYDGKSNIKDFEAGYRDALEKAANAIPTSNHFDHTEKLNQEEPRTPIDIKASASAPAANTDTTLLKLVDKTESFSNGIVNVNRIIISENQFILADPNFSTPYATFNASTKNDVYRVQLQDGSQTLGYIEDGNIVIERKTADETYIKEILRLQ